MGHSGRPRGSRGVRFQDRVEGRLFWASARALSPIDAFPRTHLQVLSGRLSVLFRCRLVSGRSFGRTCRCGLARAVGTEMWASELLLLDVLGRGSAGALSQTSRESGSVGCVSELGGKGGEPPLLRPPLPENLKDMRLWQCDAVALARAFD